MTATNLINGAGCSSGATLGPYENALCSLDALVRGCAMVALATGKVVHEAGKSMLFDQSWGVLPAIERNKTSYTTVSYALIYVGSLLCCIPRRSSTSSLKQKAEEEKPVADTTPEDASPSTSTTNNASTQQQPTRRPQAAEEAQPDRSAEEAQPDRPAEGTFPVDL